MLLQPVLPSSYRSLETWRRLWAIEGESFSQNSSIYSFLAGKKVCGQFGPLATLPPTPLKSIAREGFFYFREIACLPENCSRGEERRFKLFPAKSAFARGVAKKIAKFNSGGGEEFFSFSPFLPNISRTMSSTSRNGFFLSFMKTTACLQMYHLLTTKVAFFASSFDICF